MRFFEGYKCGFCGHEVPAGSSAGECPVCSGPLLAVYDTSIMRRVGFDWNALRAGGEAGIWKYSSLLPSFECRLSLGEAGSPLVPACNLGRSMDVPNLFIKDESSNPTGSFKARGMAAAVSRLSDLGVKRAYIPSAGNAGLALAAYCAAAGIECTVFLPQDTPEGVAEECSLYGAEVVAVNGIIADAARALDERVGADRSGVVSTFREPCRVEGKKTIAFEIAEQLHPDWIVFPTGGGTGIVAIWKAYRELMELGLIDDTMPRLALVQAQTCAPLASAWERGEDRAIPWSEPETIASGIRVPSSRADRLVLAAVRESCGASVTVSDEEIVDAVRLLARTTGIFASPEGGAALAGLKKLIEKGYVSSASTVVVVNTAGGARYRFLLDGCRD